MSEIWQNKSQLQWQSPPALFHPCWAPVEKPPVGTTGVYASIGIGGLGVWQELVGTLIHFNLGMIHSRGRKLCQQKCDVALKPQMNENSSYVPHQLG